MSSAIKASAIAQKLAIGPLKRLYKYMTPQTISLAGGLPMDDLFPFKSISVDLGSNNSYSLVNKQNLLMNYTRGDGIASLKSWINTHVQEMHHPRETTETCMTIGSTDGWAKTLELIDTDVIFFDNFIYGAASNMSHVLGKKNIGVAFDSEGMIPDALRTAVFYARNQGFKANLVYFIPVGHNPSGQTMTFERKQILYQLCQELDLIIVEDGK
jgi:aromatic amino acid aminotransferase I / 2-aminoadipate transaminase